MALLTTTQIQLEINALEFAVLPTGRYTVDINGHEVAATSKKGTVTFYVDGKRVERKDLLATIQD